MKKVTRISADDPKGGFSSTASTISNLLKSSLSSFIFNKKNNETLRVVESTINQCMYNFKSNGIIRDFKNCTVSYSYNNNNSPDIFIEIAYEQLFPPVIEKINLVIT